MKHNRLISVITAIALLIGILPLGAYAADYDTGTNVLASAVKKTVSFDSNNNDDRDTIGAALTDGIRESASGSGKTKWFVMSQYISDRIKNGEIYAEFELPSVTKVYKLTVCSKTNTSTLNPLTAFELQCSTDGTKWSTVLNEENNKNNLYTGYFEPTDTKYVRLVAKAADEFRVTEVQLETPGYTYARLEREFSAQDIISSGKIENVFEADFPSDMNCVVKYTVDGVSYTADEIEDGKWRISAPVAAKDTFYDFSLSAESNGATVYSTSTRIWINSEAELLRMALAEYLAASVDGVCAVFEKYNAVYEIDVSYIEDEYLNSAITVLKTYNITSYKDIPQKLSEAYKKAKTFDYNLSDNVLASAVKATVSKDDNNADYLDEIGAALIDGVRESAPGTGKTKWFIFNPGSDSYALFELPEPVTVHEITVYSKTIKGTTDNPISGFVLQYSDDNITWKDALTVSGNRNNLCTKRFDAVTGKYFRVMEKSNNDFRVTEISLKKSYSAAGFDKALSGNEIYDSGRFENTFTADCDASLDAYLEVSINGAPCTVTKTASGWSINTPVAQNESGYLLDVKLRSRAYGITLFSLSQELKVYSYKQFIGVINAGGSTEEFVNSFDGISELVASYGYDTKLVVNDSDAAKNKIKELVYSYAPYAVSEASVERIVGIIETNMPMISVNCAETAQQMRYCAEAYSAKYGVDISFIDAYNEAEKNNFYENVIAYRNAHGGFSSLADLAAAAEYAKECVKNYSAYYDFKRANALTLPLVFEKYKDVVAVDISFIPAEYLNKTLFLLKKMNITSYAQIPSMLTVAYNEALSGKEAFDDAYIYDAKERNYTLSSDVGIALPSLEYNGGFYDMAGFDWAAEAVNYLYSAGIVNGRSENSFAPDDGIMREEFVKLCAVAFGFENDEYNAAFADVASDQWYYPFVSALSSRNIVNGVDSQNFGIGERITREDIAAILYRIANICGISMDIRAGAMFADGAQISDYAQMPVEILSANSIINGDENGCFNPKQSATRAEAAVMIYNLMMKDQL